MVKDVERFRDTSSKWHELSFIEHGRRRRKDRLYHFMTTMNNDKQVARLHAAKVKGVPLTFSLRFNNVKVLLY